MSPIVGRDARCNDAGLDDRAEYELEFDSEQASGAEASVPDRAVDNADAIFASSLSVADFQRIGIDPRETRLAVIRRAASRAARGLATLQLSSPSSATEQQLFQVAMSTYRLLDPRQRGDRHSRAHVGRIRPGVLQSAGRASFSKQANPAGSGDQPLGDVSNNHSDDDSVGRASYLDPTDQQNGLLVSTTNDDIDNVQDGVVGGLIDRAESRSPVPVIDLPPVVGQGFEAPFVARDVPDSLLNRVRRFSRRPGAVMSLIVVLILATIGVWYWGHTMAQLPRDRFYQR